MLRNKLVVNQPSKCHNKLNLFQYKVGEGGGGLSKRVFLGLQFTTDGAITGRAYTVSRGAYKLQFIVCREMYNCKIHTKQLC